jgi:hypothetical protein
MPKGIIYAALTFIHIYFTFIIFPSAFCNHTTNISVLSTDKQRFKQTIYNNMYFLSFCFFRILGVQIAHPVHEDYRLDNRGITLWFPAEGKRRFCSPKVPDWCWDHLTSI